MFGLLISVAVIACLSLGALGYLSRGNGSYQMRLTIAYLRLTGKTPNDESSLQKRFLNRTYPRPAPFTKSLTRHCSVREETVLGYTVYVISPKLGLRTRKILYTHGGGFVNNLEKAHWNIISELARATGATILVPDYPLAPEHGYEEAFLFLDQVYAQALTSTQPNDITLCGDSAGGNLALAQAVRYRDKGIPLPRNLILFAPWLDLTMSNPSALEVESRDPMLSIEALRQWGKWWAGKADPKLPLISPLFAKLDGLPPAQIYVGTDDVLEPDAASLRDRIVASGGRVDYYLTESAFHVFMGATFTPEAKRVFKQIKMNLF